MVIVQQISSDFNQGSAQNISEHSVCCTMYRLGYRSFGQCDLNNASVIRSNTKGIVEDDHQYYSDIEYSAEKRLVDKLMRGYDNSVRPVKNASHAIVIRLGITLTQIFDLKDISKVPFFFINLCSAESAWMYTENTSSCPITGNKHYWARSVLGQLIT
ncbi:hypothetical protein TNCT_18621 [Trichonephila clavata]|uniref:Neurotransmitter-gated ion-channel ligand-binding domain-containing protein n=1 Tax=Trichonephila clavata TaxID=2740835 RepID=A0A8X6HW80_TRICU|nr:hypothetical protein TNCT_18621 [Trichonephila clavata]